MNKRHAPEFIQQTHISALFIRFFLPVAALILVGIAFYGNSEIERELTRLKSQETLNVGLGAGTLTGKIENVTKDLLFLAHHSALRQAVTNPKPENLNLLAENFASFSRNKGIYDQIRWLDETGMEIVRVDLVQGKPVIVSAENLQNKGRRYFFYDSVKLRHGEIFVSPLDLNIEYGKIEEPYKPMLRVATPVIDTQGLKRGIVILNYYGRELLQAFSAATAGIAYHIMVVNRDGYLLKSPQANEEWGFMFKKPELSLAVRAAKAWHHIAAEESGQLMLPDGLWTWQTVYPLVVGQKSSTGATDAFVPSRGEVETRQYMWKSVAHLPAKTLSTVSRDVWAKLAAVGFLLLALLGFGSWKLAQAWAARSSAEAELQHFNAGLESTVAERTKKLNLATRILEGISQGVIITDAQHRITEINPSFGHITGYVLGDVAGRVPSELLVARKNSDALTTSVLAALTDRGYWQGEVLLERKNGEPCPAWFNISRITGEPEEQSGFVTFVNDITELKQAEEERDKLTKQLLHTQKLESLGVLAGGIAHDFNNILMAIIGNAELALRRINKESPAENLHRIVHSAARAADLAKQMLAYSGRGKFVVEDINLNNVMEDMLHLLEISISKKAVLRLDLHQNLPAVEADATQIRQIIMNLVINASEAIGDNNGVIAITTGCVDCDRNYLKDVWLDENLTDGLYVYLEIADSGCGMDKEILSKIFDPFFTTKFTGRGLGMAAVLGIIRGHKGAIKVCSEPGKGTSFKVLLPASERPPKQLSVEDQHGGCNDSATVLLVDDEEMIRGIGKEMLHELGFKVICASDGREAIEIFKANSDIGFVILDLTMPHMDGEQCFRELRQLKPDIKVIITSGYNEQEVTQKFVGKGLAGFVQKPYKLSELTEAIRKIQERGTERSIPDS